METFAAPDVRSPSRRLGMPAGALITVAGLAAILFLWMAAVPYLRVDPARYGRLWATRGWLWIHIAGGTVALLIGPVQLWLGITRARVAVHRVLGRVYVGAIAIGAVAAFYLAATTQIGWMFGTGITGLAVSWVVTTGFAWAAIKRRLILHHREWMIRSYVVTLAFVNFRALFEVLRVANIGTVPERAGVCAWFCWSVPLLITEIALQAPKIFRRTAQA